MNTKCWIDVVFWLIHGPDLDSDGTQRSEAQRCLDISSNNSNRRHILKERSRQRRWKNVYTTFVLQRPYNNFYMTSVQRFTQRLCDVYTSFTRRSYTVAITTKLQRWDNHQKV